jgi:hypothetical protein
MSIFEDKTYNEMDWVSQAVEPIVSSLNEKLSKFPEEFEFTLSDITRLAFGGYSDLAINQIQLVEHALRKYMQVDARKVEQEIINAYTLVVEGDPVLDADKLTLCGGRIYIKRTIDHFDEKTLLSMMGKQGLSQLQNLDTRKVDVTRANEIIELIGGYDALLKTKSLGQKCNGIHNAIATIMATNKWNLRNVDLSNRIVEWVYLYLQHGNLAALTNFCKFKVMTHEGNAIYSVQEEPV